MLKYEDFVTNPEAYLQQIAVFFEFKFESAMLDFNKNIAMTMEDNSSIKDNQRLVTKYSDLSKPVNSDRISAWKTKLSDKELNIINYINHDAASFFGYEMGTRSKKSVSSLYYVKTFCKFYLSILKNKMEYFAPLPLKIRAIS